MSSIRSNTTIRPYKPDGRSSSTAEILRSPRTIRDLDEFHHWIKLFVMNRYQVTPSQAPYGLNPLYETFIRTAKFIDARSELHDKLVFLFLSIAQVDVLYRRLHPGRETDRIPPWHVTGTDDFHEVLQRQWRTILDRGAMGPIANLAAFSAKLLALSGYPALSGIALDCIRKALGDEKDMVTDPPQRKSNRCLPAAAIWFEFAGSQLLALCFTSLTQLDPAAEARRFAAGGDRYSAPGFSPTQWVFWRRGMQEFCRDSNEGIARDAKRCYFVMMACGRTLGFDVPGEAVFAERAQAAAEGKGKSTGRAVPLDFEDDIDWVDE